MKKLAPILIALLWVVIGCTKSKEVVQIKSDSGKLIEEFEKSTKTGKKNGYYKRFDLETSKLVSECTYIEDTLEGLRTLYYPNGQPQAKENYLHGQEEGNYQTFYDNGKLKSEGKHSNHAMNGIWKYYYPSGNLKETVTFVNSQEDGPFIEYYDSGKKKAEGTYKVGMDKFGQSNASTDQKEHGELKLYDESGELTKVMQCEYGVCQTKWKK